MYRYRAGNVDGVGEELFSAPALQASLGAARRHQTQEALRKRLAPVKAVQLACRVAQLVLAGAADGGEGAALDLTGQVPETDYAMPPPPPRPQGGSRAYTAPPPSPRFMVRAGMGGSGGRHRALGGQ